MSEAKETRVDWLLTLAVVGGIAGVAYADSLVEPISLGYLYVLPLALSAMIHRLRTTMLLVAACVVLHDWLGPFGQVPTGLLISRNLLTLAGFSTAVLFVHQLTLKRRELTEVVRVQRDELAREIALAAEVQQRLLPRSAPRVPGFELAGRMLPAKTVGGDYYDFIELPAGGLGLVMADVSGKGVAAALLMPSVEMALRMDAHNSSHTNELMKALNRHFFDCTDETRYVTLFYGKLNVAQGSMEYTNAGHMPPLLLRGRSSEVLWLEKGGSVVGLVPNAEYETGTVALGAGDVLVLYTDGLTEAQNLAGEEYSRPRLLGYVQEHRTQSAEGLLTGLFDSVMDFVGPGQLRDDLTLMVLKVTTQ